MYSDIVYSMPSIMVGGLIASGNMWHIYVGTCMLPISWKDPFEMVSKVVLVEHFLSSHLVIDVLCCWLWWWKPFQSEQFPSYQTTTTLFFTLKSLLYIIYISRICRLNLLFLATFTVHITSPRGTWALCQQQRQTWMPMKTSSTFVLPPP